MKNQDPTPSAEHLNKVALYPYPSGRRIEELVYVGEREVGITGKCQLVVVLTETPTS